MLASIDGPERRRLLRAASQVLYADPGNLVFVREGALVAQPFDAIRLELRGEPVPIAEAQHVGINPGTPRGMFAISQTGIVAFRTATTAALGWFDRTGNPLGWVSGVDGNVSPALSRDGQHLAVSQFDPVTTTRSIWIYDLRYGGVGSRLSNADASWETCPVWSPDGSKVIFAAGSLDDPAFYEKELGRTSEERVLPHSPSGCPLDWSPDGQSLVYATQQRSRDRGLYRLPLAKDGAPSLLAGPWPPPQERTAARISPDGRWLAYASSTSGRNEIYIRPFPSGPGMWQVSSHGGMEPQWRGDGHELFFLGADKRLMAVPLRTEGGIQLETPTALFRTNLDSDVVPIVGRNQYVASADGQRFLLNQPQPDRTAGDIVVLANWVAALKK